MIGRYILYPSGGTPPAVHVKGSSAPLPPFCPSHCHSRRRISGLLLPVHQLTRARSQVTFHQPDETFPRFLLPTRCPFVRVWRPTHPMRCCCGIFPPHFVVVVPPHGARLPSQFFAWPSVDLKKAKRRNLLGRELSPPRPLSFHPSVLPAISGLTPWEWVSHGKN